MISEESQRIVHVLLLYLKRKVNCKVHKEDARRLVRNSTRIRDGIAIQHQLFDARAQKADLVLNKRCCEMKN